MPESIQNCEQLRAAIAEHKSQRPNDKGEERSLLHRAIEIGCVEDIPDEWGVEVHGQGTGNQD